MVSYLFRLAESASVRYVPFAFSRLAQEAASKRKELRAMIGNSAVAKAQSNPQPVLPPMDIVGPTVDDDIGRAIDRYGEEAVKESVKELTKAKVGRPTVNDFQELFPVIDEDARVWLDGGDPFAARSNFSIAKIIADENPGHSHPATMKRIQRKLGSPTRGRKWYTLVLAWTYSEKAYPHAAHIRALRELHDLEPLATLWRRSLKRAESSIADYTAKHGEPADTLTMAQVEAGAKEPLNALRGLGRVDKRLQP